ncbi:MAG: PKD domain-containing protein [Bacteroidetes bacterium]|nr:PKD domain-containing protein [Bacteroidota bacterium]
MLFFLTAGPVQAQTCQDASVELSAVVQSFPKKITLKWLSNSGATQYTIYRKLKTDAGWGTVMATLPGTSVQFMDLSVNTATSYEYKVVRTASNYTGYGYINSGIEMPAVEQRGTLILLVDNTFTTSCSSEIARLQTDLAGDGWKVIRHDVAPAAAVTAVKSLIVADYNLDPANTRAVFILGHVPVPYSGNINPDGHPDHQGAWPADVYYGDVNGSWTDVVVNNSTASDPRNQNIPGDGKFDQSTIPSDVELQVGRVDFSNMPAFASPVDQLIRNYLDKDHNYRHKVFSPVHRALVDDNFGYFGSEAFAASGWKNFGPLVGYSQVGANDYFTTMNGNSYLWSYGCGGGWYQGAGGIGSTSDFAVSNLQGVFTILFGSYFGDWDSQNNFLRAPLAQGTMLTNCWSGRPHWMLHHMGMGENIGYDALISQNNSSTYFASYGARFVHIALMGDPTLRNDVVAPVSQLVASSQETDNILSWTASTDTILGYYVYRKKEAETSFTRLTQTIITSTSYTDACIVDSGNYVYMIKAMRLQLTPSGSYYNLSQGIFDTVWHPDTYLVTASAGYNTNGDTVFFLNSSNHATSYLWDFGDGTTSTLENPYHIFLPGSHSVSLFATNGCTSDTVTYIIQGPTLNTLSGVISYDNNANSGMSNTTVELVAGNNGVVATTQTDQDGIYLFELIPDGSYTLHVTTTLLPGSINSTDALLALKHFVHLSLLTGLKLKAGDVDNNNMINSIDALMISRRFTGQLQSFPAGDWYFENPQVTLSGNAGFIQNVKCIGIGDCNGSYIP